MEEIRNDSHGEDLGIATPLRAGAGMIRVRSICRAIDAPELPVEEDLGMMQDHMHPALGHMETSDIGQSEGDGYEEPEVVEYATQAQVTFDGREYRIAYREPEDVGMESTRTTLIFHRDRPNVFHLSRVGFVSSMFTFEAGKITEGAYSIKVGGAMPFSVDTLSLDNRLVSEGRLVVNYHLLYQGIVMEQMHLAITWCAE